MQLHSQIVDEMIDIDHRRVMYKILLIIMSIFLGCFAVYNTYNKSYSALAIFEVCFAGFSIFLFLNLSKIENKEGNYLKWLTRIYVSVIAIFLCFLFCYKFKHSIQLWIFCIPAMCYLLLGKKWGVWLTGISFALSFIGFYVRFSDQMHMLDTRLIANIICISVTTWVISHIYESKTYDAQSKIAAIAITDPLTSLLNRNMLETIFKKNKKSGLSIILFDIDFFKKVNDNYGHESGDLVLVEFSKNLQNFFSNKGYVFRIGGEEFCVVLPSYDLKKALNIAKSFQIANNEHSIDITNSENKSKNQMNSELLKVTFSAGIASTDDDSTLIEVLNVADKCLYNAKDNGRNRIEVEKLD